LRDWRVAPLVHIRQHEQVQTREQQQEQRKQRRVRQQAWKLLGFSHAHCDEVGDHGQRKDNAHPAVKLSNPVRVLGENGK